MPAHRPCQSPWTQLLNEIVTAWPPVRWLGVGVVVGCSGGADSVALLRGLVELSRDQASRPAGFIIAAHFNHGLRGAESSADADSVATFARQLDVRLHSTDAPVQPTTPSVQPPSRDEATLRTQRRAFLLSVARATGARYIALGHSADDNVETMLHHLLRGTGPQGLAGMLSHRAFDGADEHADFVLARPLLRVRRELIRDALRDKGQSWREDSSNADTAYGRNWIRHELLPQIEVRYPQATPAISRLMNTQHEWRRVIDGLALQWLDRNCLTPQPPELRRGTDQDRSIVVAALQRCWDQQHWPRGQMTQTHWQRLDQTIRTTHPERYRLPGEIDIIAETDRVRLLPA